MYDDPANVRDKEIKVRLSEREKRLVAALADYNHSLLAPFVRDLLLESLATYSAKVTDDHKAA